jgi:hypothetical protein
MNYEETSRNASAVAEAALAGRVRHRHPGFRAIRAAPIQNLPGPNDTYFSVFQLNSGYFSIRGENLITKL